MRFFLIKLYFFSLRSYITKHKAFLVAIGLSCLISFLILFSALYSVIVTNTFYELSTPSTEPDIIIYHDNNQTLEEIYEILKPHTHGIRQMWQYQKTWGALSTDDTLIPIEVIKLINSFSPITIKKPELYSAEHSAHGNKVYLATEKKYTPFKSVEIGDIVQFSDGRSSVPTLVLPPESDVTLTTPIAIGIFMNSPITPSYLYSLCSILQEHTILASPSMDKNTKKSMLFSLLQKVCRIIQIALLILLAISLIVALFYFLEGYQKIKSFLITRNIPITALRITTYFYSLVIAGFSIILPIIILFTRTEGGLKRSYSQLDSDEKVFILLKLWLRDSCPSIVIFSSVIIIVCFLLWVMTRERSKRFFSKKRKTQYAKDT